MKKLFYVMLYTLSLNLYLPAVFAAKIQVTGLGEITHEPDVVQVSLNVQAKCYPSLAKAAEAADTLAADLFKKITGMFPTNDRYNQVITHGGYTQPYYPVRTRNTPSVCDNTYQKNVQIKIITTQLKDFERLFNQIQKLVYQEYPQMNEGNIAEPALIVTLTEPTTQLSFERQKQLEMQALEDALVHAKEKAAQLTAQENSTQLKLVELFETAPNTMPFPRAVAASGLSFRAESSAPISFEQNLVQKQVTAIFEY